MNIRSIPLFQNFSDSEVSELKSCFQERTFDKGQNLFLEGNSCEKIFFVKTGRVKLYRMNSQGREQILQTLGPGETCACNPGVAEWDCSSSAQAITSCTVWFLSKDRYVELIKTNAKLAHSLNYLFAKRLQCFSALIEEVSLKDSKKRVIKFLLDMSSQNNGDSTLSIPFTREELAQRIGTTRETVARQLHALKNKQLIGIKPHQILIHNREALKKLL